MRQLDVSERSVALLENLATLVVSGIPLRQAVEIPGRGARIARSVRRLTRTLMGGLSEGDLLYSFDYQVRPYNCILGPFFFTDSIPLSHADVEEYITQRPSPQ